jgi:Ca-activated chloride channel homolog
MKQHIFHITITVISLLLIQAGAFAQEGTSKLIRQGNAQYKKQQYADAEASYKKALERNNKSIEGNYNLANSLYEQKRFDAARQQYANTIKTATGKDVKADASYNIGNTFMEDKKWEESIKSYKASLKANPRDEQARYNLAYAQAMLKKQQQQGGGKDNKENKDKQKDQKDKKDQDKKDQQKQDQKQNQGEKEQDKEQQQQPQPKPSKLSPEEAKRLLQNLAQQEKKLQEDKMKKVKGTPGSVEKDW